MYLSRFEKGAGRRPEQFGRPSAVHEGPFA